MTNPRRRSRSQTPEHRKSIKDIHLGIEKQNRLKRVGKLKLKLAKLKLLINVTKI